MNKNLNQGVASVSGILLIVGLVFWVLYLLDGGVSPYSCLPGKKEVRGFSSNGDYIIMCMKE